MWYVVCDKLCVCYRVSVVLVLCVLWCVVHSVWYVCAKVCMCGMCSILCGMYVVCVVYCVCVCGVYVVCVWYIMYVSVV